MDGVLSPINPKQGGSLLKTIVLPTSLTLIRLWKWNARCIFSRVLRKEKDTTLPMCSISPRFIQTNALEHLVFYVPFRHQSHCTVMMNMDVHSRNVLFSRRKMHIFFFHPTLMSLGIQGWAGDWVSVGSKCIMGLLRRTLSPLSLAITKLRGKMGLNASPAIVPQCRKFRPPPTPKSKMQK